MSTDPRILWRRWYAPPLIHERGPECLHEDDPFVAVRKMAVLLVSNPYPSTRRVGA